MPDPGRIYQVVEKHRRDLLRNERTAASAMVREYGAAWQRVRAQLDALIAQIEEAQRAGKKVSPAWLFQQNRLQSLLYQVEAEIARFVDYAEPEIARQQRAAVEAAQRHVWEQVSVLTDDETILAKFDRLAAEVVSDLIGFTESGPLHELLDKLGPQVSKGFREAMIESLVLGRNPRETARRVRREFGVGLARALRISRTETLRAYREATRRNYQENSDIVEGWLWLASKSARTCVMCLAMDGTFHTLDERLDDHPGGRCVMAPAVKGVPRPLRETGAEWFEKQDEATQRKVLGNAGYEAYKAGAVELQDFVGQRWSRDWGTTRYARSLKSALAVAANAPPPKVGFFRAVRQAERWARENYSHITWDFAGMDIEAVNPTLKQFHHLAQEFPEVAQRLRYIGTYGNDASRFSSPYILAHASMDGSFIGLNPLWFGDVRVFKELLAAAVKIGFHPKGCDTIESVITHEFGHLMHGWLQSKYKSAVLPYVGADGTGLVADTVDRWLAKNKPTRRFSEYAKESKDVRENFAEGFASLRHTHARQQHQFVKRLGVMLQELADPAKHIPEGQWDFLNFLSGDDKIRAIEALNEFKRRLNL